MEPFVHLHCHTHYSSLDGMSKVNQIVDKAIADGMKGVAITDHGDMFGVKDLFDYCNKVNGKRKKEGLELFKPIFGCEAYVARRTKFDKERDKHDLSGHHLVLLAKNEVGYHNLCRLMSEAWVDGFYGKPRTDHDDLKKYHEGVICLSACIAGEVPDKILKGDIAGARESAKWFKDVFGDDYYLELQRHEVKDPNIRANRETFQLQQIANKEIIKIAKELDIKIVCTNDCHFVDEDNAEAHDILICLSTNADYYKGPEERMMYTKQEWFKTQAEMNEIFSDVPEALSNTLEVLDKVETFDLESNPIMPFYPIPEEFGTEEQWRQKFSEEDIFKEFTSDENGENPLPREEGQKKIDKLGGIDKLYRIKFEADYLGKLAYEGAHRLYGETLSAEVDDRIRFELHIMKTMGFPGYFLIVQDFINSARKELNVWVGPGRGSAAGSVVAYCLGITKIDPLKYDLLFERFLNPDRISLPDIDTDFDDDGRGLVLKWVMDKYGHENCAHIITYSSMATKNSIKDVARVLKLPLDIANALCKAIPDRLQDDKGNALKMNLKNAITCTPMLQEAEKSNDPILANTIKYAKMLEGTYRGTGIHACGFIICRDPISEHVPVSTAEDPDFKGTKVPVTQYDGHVIESTGLIKMDFLGLKTLSDLKEACNVIKAVRGVDIDLDHIPIDDPVTYKLYQEGRTVGTFQFESAGMQKYLRELKPTVFEDLIAMNALYRPGPMDNIPEFIERKQGRKPISYDIPVMEKYLKDTYGITVYQEQVMLLSRLLADFTRGQSDALRKAMGKKKKDIVDQMKPMFIEGGKKNGHDPKMLEKIWSDWEKFASYAFNKSHAACYSWVAFQTAYLKANYPAEYMAAIMTRRKDDIKEITKLMDECRQLKIDTLGPDINESFNGFGVNKKGQIRFGLAAIKGMGAQAADSIINERKKNGPYTSVYDFMERINLSCCNRRVVENLIYAGALDCFTDIKREQYFQSNSRGEVFVDALISYANRVQNDTMNSAPSLFGDMEEFQITKPDIPPFTGRWSLLDMLNQERERIGIFLSSHPLDEYKVVLKKCCQASVLELERENILDLFERTGSEASINVGGIVTGVREMLSRKSNKPFGIVKLEDYDGEGEIAIFDRWTELKNYFTTHAAVYINVSLQQSPYDPTRISVKINSVKYLSDVQKDLLQNFNIRIPVESFTKPISNYIKAHIQEHPGSTKLNFTIVDSTTRAPLDMTVPQGIELTYDFIRTLEETEGITTRIEN